MSHWPETESLSHGLYQRARQVLPGGISRQQTWIDPYPIYAGRGEGPFLTDVDGVRRFDLMNNFAALIHGHAHPVVVERVADALGRGSCFSMPTEVEIELAELLCRRIDRVEQVRFCNSGTEAVMLALKAARAKTGRSRIAKIEGAYHGMYDYAEVSLDPGPDNWGNEPTPRRYSQGTPDAVLEDTLVLPLNQEAAAERILRAAGDELAAVLIDPVPNACGMIEMTPDYIDCLQRIARELGAQVIVDEVIAFRLGYHGAQARYGIVADYSTYAKIIGGGFAVGAVGGTTEAMAVFSHELGKPLNPSSGTLTGNPVAMTAGLATMELLTPEAYQDLEHLGAHARRVVADAFEGAGVPGQVTGVGGMFQIHLHERPLGDYRSAYLQPEEAAAVQALHRALMEAGYILAPKLGGYLSTVMTVEQLDGFGAALTEALRGSLRRR